MAILSKGHDFSSGDNVTATKLDDLVDQATFVGGSGGATDNSTLEVNDGVGGDYHRQTRRRCGKHTEDCR